MNAQAIIPDRPLADPAALGAELARVIDEAAQQIAKEFAGTVETWNEKPAFAVETSAPLTRNIYTRNQIYEWVNDGTPPHEILPITAHALSFMTGGASKSSVGSLGARPGAEGSEHHFSRGVHHPGVAARQFDRLIEEAWLEIFPARIQAAIDEIFA